MRSFGRTLRGAASAMALGAMTAAGLAVVSVAMAPAAMAQKPPQQTKAFIAAYQAAQAANTASDWAGVTTQTDIMLREAKDNTAKAAAYTLRLRAFANLNDKPKLIESIEGMLGTGLLDATQAKGFKENLAGLYSETGNDAKAEEVTRAFIAEYGGNAQQHAWLAQRALNAKNYDEAIASADKAIQIAKAAGQKPVDRHYNLKINAAVQSQKMDIYYAALEQAASDYPSEVYMRPLIEKAMRDPKYNTKELRLDVYRALVAAKVTLKPEEVAAMGEQAYTRGLAIEAEEILKPVQGSAGPDVQKLFTTVQGVAKQDRAGGLTTSEKEAAAAANGNLFIATGENYFGLGDYAKAADLIQKGIAKGGLKPEDEALAKLRLGIAQFKAGQKDAAVATWQQVKSDNGAESLAKAWTAIAKA